jgi:hypothetical protein
MGHGYVKFSFWESWYFRGAWDRDRDLAGNFHRLDYGGPSGHALS